MKRLFFLLALISSCLCISFTTSNNQSSNDDDDKTKNITEEAVKIEWLSLDQAIAKQRTHPKKIFVDIYTDWCIWCTKMEKATFEHPYIAEYINANFYPVKLDAETKQSMFFKNNQYYFKPNEGRHGRGVHEIAIYLTRGRLNYPSIVFLDENASNPQPIAGFQNPIRMDKLLKFFGEGYYKQIDWLLFNQIYKSPLDQKKSNRTRFSYQN